MADDSKALNVLIVDDSAVVRAIIRKAVRIGGRPVETIHEATDGVGGLAVLASNQVDVVFTDINMPVMTGIEMLREMTARGFTRPTRIVVSTDGSTILREQVAELGVRLLLTKPFAPEAIRDALSFAH